MNDQLPLIHPPIRPPMEPASPAAAAAAAAAVGAGRSGTWQIDDHTRSIGRRGLAQARAALRQAHAPAEPSSRAA